MSDIQFLYTEGQPYEAITKQSVGLEGQIVGEIRKVEGGYQYFPRGQKAGGEVFATLGECQQSLKD